MTIAEQQLELEKEEAKVMVKTCEEKHTKKYIEFINERLATFGKLDVECIICPGIEILEPYIIDATGQIVDADDSEETDQDMNEDNTVEQNDISIKEASASDTGDAMLMGINSLALVTLQRNHDNEEQVNKSFNPITVTESIYTGELIRATLLRSGTPYSIGKKFKLQNCVKCLLCIMQILDVHIIRLIKVTSISITTSLNHTADAALNSHAKGIKVTTFFLM